MQANDRGIYIAVFRLTKGCDIEVGRLGVIRFEAGYYFYAGSAQRGLSARLARHARRRKPFHWHVDYLSSKAEMLGAITMPGERSDECRLAGELRKRLNVAARGFGASDCRCGGHLFHASRWPV